MQNKPAELLTQLELIKFTFNRRAAKTKLALLRRLENTVLDSADEVSRLHTLLCFMRAYPDDRSLLDQVKRMLAGFADREDLRRNREELVNSGIAGTDVEYPFFWFTLGWLADRWPDRLRIDWKAIGKRRALLDRRLPMLMPYCETLALEEATMTTREWIEELEQVGIPCGPVNTIEQAANDLHIQARDMFIDIEHPQAGNFKVVNTPFKFSRTPHKVVKAAPELGEHTQDVLTQLLEMTQEEIGRLQESGII